MMTMDIVKAVVKLRAENDKMRAKIVRLNIKRNQLHKRIDALLVHAENDRLRDEQFADQLEGATTPDGCILPCAAVDELVARVESLERYQHAHANPGCFKSVGGNDEQ